VAGRLLYLDASALVKLVVEEPESGALAELLGEGAPAVASIVVAAEVPRALRRAGVPEVLGRAGDVLARVDLLALDGDVARVAAGLEPPELRALDAIHLASALSVADELDAFVCYDHRLAGAADASGLPVVAPAVRSADN
jgi:predicted nucleic acid-binding protein